MVNKKSSFIDASHVYDNTDEHSKELRTKDGTGKLRSQDTKFGKLLPKNHRKETLYCPVPNIEKCFEGGDDRTNQHSMLITLQTMYLRLHNKIADSLHQLNPNWNDDKLYQESRRIVIALHQYIIYEDYLPFLIGSDNMVRYDLYPNFQDGSLYNDEVDPSMLVEFSGAAFRAHSTVSQYVSGFMPLLKFRNTYSNVQLIHNGWMNPLLTGACELPSEKNDEFQAEDISDYLYKGPGETYGGDMTATDIQRGRDIGLPSYTQMLHFCFNGLQINDYSQLWNSGLMTGRSVRELMDLYDDVRDVDLLMGILREIRDDRSVFSPTAICITAIQFYRLKFGDSFFFTHTNGRNPFKREQLETLRTYSMARLICETTRVEKVRKNPFMIPSGNNPLVLCRSFSRMDFMAWKD
nr:peroxidase [Parasteatoda tepidariorum]